MPHQPNNSTHRRALCAAADAGLGSRRMTGYDVSNPWQHEIESADARTSHVAGSISNRSMCTVLCHAHVWVTPRVEPAPGGQKGGGVQQKAARPVGRYATCSILPNLCHDVSCTKTVQFNIHFADRCRRVAKHHSGSFDTKLLSSHVGYPL